MSEFDKRMSTYKKIAGFMPEKISSDEVAKNNAAVEANTKKQTDAAIAILSKKNTQNENIEENAKENFKPFSFENAPIYKSLNQENSEQNNKNNSNNQNQSGDKNSQNYSPVPYVDPNAENTQFEQMPKTEQFNQFSHSQNLNQNTSPFVPSIPKPPVNNFSNLNNAENVKNAENGENKSAFENFSQLQNMQNFQNSPLSESLNNSPALNNSPNASSLGNLNNLSNGENVANTENFSNYKNIPPQQSEQNFSFSPNLKNENNFSDFPQTQSFQTENNFENFPQSQNIQNFQNSPFLESLNNSLNASSLGNLNNLSNGENVANTENFSNYKNIPPQQSEQNFSFSPNLQNENNSPNLQNTPTLNNSPAQNNSAFSQNLNNSLDFNNFNNSNNFGNFNNAENGAENGENKRDFENFSNSLDYQNQAQALQNQGARAFANLRSALNENYKNTLQNVVQNQNANLTSEQEIVKKTENAKPSAVPYQAVPYMPSNQSTLPRYQADEEENEAQNFINKQNSQTSQQNQNAQKNWQQKQTLPKKGFWQKLQEAFSPSINESENNANLGQIVNLQAPQNASKFNQNYAAQSLRNLQKENQNENDANKNQQEWNELSREFVQNQQKYSQITSAYSEIGEKAREIIPPKNAEGTQFDFASFAAKQTGSAFEAKKFSAQPLENFYIKKQVQENSEKNKNTVSIPNIKGATNFSKNDNIFYKIPTGKKDSNARRVAKFLLLIGTDEAAKIIAQLPQEQVEKIVPEIASIRRVEPEEKAQILAEFQGLMQKAKESGGITTARTILEKAFGDQQAQDIMQRAVPFDGGKPFDYLQKFDGEQLSLVLKDESVPVKALVLSQVKPAVAASVINQMNERERKETVLRLSRLSKFSPDILSRIDRTLREKAENIKMPSSNSIDGRGALASILRKMDANAEKNILSNLSLVDGELESDLRKRLFTIDDVIAADDKFLQKKLHSMSDDTIAMIIHGKQSEFRKKILNNISKTRGISVLEEEDAKSPYSKKELERLTNEFMNMLRAAWEKGELMLNNSDEEWI